METLSYRVRQFMLMGLVGLLIGYTANSFAAKTISVVVEVDSKIAKSRTIIGTGFSVNGRNHGSLGKRAKRTGPADTKYSFGFRDFHHDVSCGSAVLQNDSTVTLYFSGKQCRNRVVPKNQHQLVLPLRSGNFSRYLRMEK